MSTCSNKGPDGGETPREPIRVKQVTQIVSNPVVYLNDASAEDDNTHEFEEFVCVDKSLASRNLCQPEAVCSWCLPRLYVTGVNL